jgi:hypothetical protein
MFAALNEHGHMLGFGLDTSSDTSSSASRLSKSKSISGDKDFFGDVMKLKRGMTFDETETKIRVESTEEAEEAKKERKRTRPPAIPKRPTATVLPALEVAHTQDTGPRRKAEGSRGAEDYMEYDSTKI